MFECIGIIRIISSNALGSVVERQVCVSIVSARTFDRTVFVRAFDRAAAIACLISCAGIIGTLASTMDSIVGRYIAIVSACAFDRTIFVRTFDRTVVVDRLTDCSAGIIGTLASTMDIVVKRCAATIIIGTFGSTIDVAAKDIKLGSRDGMVWRSENVWCRGFSMIKVLQMVVGRETVAKERSSLVLCWKLRWSYNGDCPFCSRNIDRSAQEHCGGIQSILRCWEENQPT